MTGGGFRSYKLLYYNTHLSLENIQEGLMSIVNRNNAGELYVVLVEIGYAGQFYSLTKALYIIDEESVAKAMGIIKSQLELVKIKYRLEGVLNLAIKGRIFLPQETYQEMKDVTFRKRLMKELDQIQKAYLANMKKGENSVKHLFDKLRKQSKVITSSTVDLTMLYLHATLYSNLEKFKGVTIEDFVDSSITEPGYKHSSKVTVDDGTTKLFWVDHHYEDGTIRRIYNGDIFVFKGGILIEIQFHYKFPSLRKPSKDSSAPTKIGVIDIETFTEGVGDNKRSVPYAVGFKVDGVVRTFYYEKGDSFNDVVVRMMKVLYKEYEGYTFYAHNLDFDGIYLLNAIIRVIDNPKKVDVLMKDNIFYKISSPRIKFLDSNKFLTASLDKVLMDFQLPFTKTDFPYTSVEESNLFSVLPIKYTTKKGKTISVEAFDMHKESLIYLENDLNGLYAAITKFAEIIYKLYSIDITKTTTISSLSFKIFLTNFYKAKEDVKVINGPVDSDIRNAHYGGVTRANKNIGNNLFYYDMNSQYPASMCNPMPVGNPILSTNIDLENSYGFFYAYILVPDDQISLVPHRTAVGQILFPSTEFTGWYFSEELKALKKLGYLVTVEGGYLFDNSVTLFSTFVETLYSSRQLAKKQGNTTLANILKLLMNSLYGKTGMNPMTTFSQIIPTNKLTTFDLKNTILREISLPNNYTLVEAELQTKDDLVKLFDKTMKVEQPKTRRPVQASVPLAAAIASYARITMFPFKNIEGNPWVYSDTDSIVLENELDPMLVSDIDLGKMKHQYNVVKGYFLGPKFYALLLEDGTSVIRCSGVNSSNMKFEDFEDLFNGAVKEYQSEVWMKDYNDKNAVRIELRPYHVKFDPRYRKLDITPAVDSYKHDN